jgi:hypothetical protein
MKVGVDLKPPEVRDVELFTTVMNVGNGTDQPMRRSLPMVCG